jgi:hypothetical protein
LIVDTLAPLVLDDVALGVQLSEVERIEEKPHAIGFEPQGGLEIVRRDRLVVGGPVIIRGAVVRSADAFRVLVMHAIRHIA